MLSPQALFKGLVRRVIPTLLSDSSDNDVSLRLEATGGVFTQSLVRKHHALVDEGSYWVSNSAQTGITPPLGVARSATVGALSIYNNDTLRRTLFLDYISLTNIVAVTATSSVVGVPSFCAFYTDTGNRYTSGGTTLNTPVNPNYAAATTAPGVTLTFGNLTLPAAVAERAIVGSRVTRGAPTTAALTLVGDQLYFNFGGSEAMIASSITLTNPNLIPIPMPAISIPYGTSGVLQLWWQNTTPAGGAAGFVPEVGFWMR